MKTGNGRIKITDYPDFDDAGWKKIDGFKDYFIHRTGFVKSVKITTSKPKRLRIKKERILSMFTIFGYPSVNLVDGHLRKSARIHILVADAFWGKRPDGCDVMHLDGNKLNSSADNLRYGSRSCNEAFKIDHGTALIGENHHQAKLTTKDVHFIRNEISKGRSCTSIAKDYNVTISNICRIKKGRSWASV